MANVCPCTLGNSVSQALNNLRKAKKLNEKGPEQTAAATVLSRKVDTCYSLEKSDSSWGYYVTFRLEDGREIRVYDTIDARLILEDFYAKLALFFRES